MRQVSRPEPGGAKFHFPYEVARVERRSTPSARRMGTSVMRQVARPERSEERSKSPSHESSPAASAGAHHHPTATAQASGDRRSTVQGKSSTSRSHTVP